MSTDTAKVSPFWKNLKQFVAPAASLGPLEKAAGLGDGTLRKGRERGTVAPPLDIVLRVASHFGCEAATLLGEDTPPELRVRPAGNDPAIRRIPFLYLAASHLNPRRTIDPAAVAELADSIAAQGLLQNLVVRQDDDQPCIYWIVAGERRFRALELLARENRMPADLSEHGITCRVTTAGDAEHIVMALVENLQRQDVNPMDEAEAIARLHALDPKKWSTAAIAASLGVTQRQVQMRLALVNKLSDQAKDDLRTGRITLAHAKVLITQSTEQQTELLTPSPYDSKRVPSAEDMARDVMDGMFPRANAVFDVPASGLDVFTDPDGEEWLPDFDAAYALQLDALNAHCTALRAQGADFFQIVEGWGGRLPGAYKPGGSGVVVVIDSQDCEAHIHHGVRVALEERPAPARSDAADLYAAQGRYNLEFDDNADAFEADIAARLTAEEADALLIWDALAPWNAKILQGGVGSDALEIQSIAAIVEAMDMGAAPDAKKRTLGWLRLLKAPRATRDTAAVRVVAERIKITNRKVHPPLFEIAAQHGIDVPAILRHSAKQRDETIARYAAEAAGQTDIEGAIADRKVAA